MPERSSLNSVLAIKQINPLKPSAGDMSPTGLLVLVPTVPQPRWPEGHAAALGEVIAQERFRGIALEAMMAVP